MSTAAYADLLFAWAHARLGDREPATALGSRATATLTEGVDPAHDWAAGAFRHRINQALRGLPHAGGHPPDLADALDHLDDNRGNGMSRRYIVDRLRDRSQVLEPDRRTNPYTHYMRQHDAFSLAVRQLDELAAPDAFAARLRSLVGRAGNAEPDRLVAVLTTAANRGDRVGGEAADLVYQRTFGLIDRFLLAAPAFRDADEPLPRLLAAVVGLAAGRRDAGFLLKVSARLVNWMRFGDRASGRRTAAALLPGLLAALLRVDLADDLAAVLDAINEAEMPLAELDPDVTRPVQMVCAGCHLWLGRADLADHVFGPVRERMFADGPGHMAATPLVRLAVDYARSVGMASAAKSGPLLLDLLGRLSPVPNTYSTATHYSRLHLDLVEAVVLAVAMDDFRSPGELADRLGADEVRTRRAVLPALRDAAASWAGGDWNPRALQNGGAVQAPAG